MGKQGVVVTESIYLIFPRLTMLENNCPFMG